MKYLSILLVISLYAADNNNNRPIVRLMDMQPRKIKRTYFQTGEWPRKDMPEFGEHKIVPITSAPTNKTEDKKPDEEAK